MWEQGLIHAHATGAPRGEDDRGNHGVFRAFPAKPLNWLFLTSGTEIPTLTPFSADGEPGMRVNGHPDGRRLVFITRPDLRPVLPENARKLRDQPGASGGHGYV